MDPHFKNLPEIVDLDLENIVTLFSTCHALWHTYFSLAYYLGCHIVTGIVKFLMCVTWELLFVLLTDLLSMKKSHLLG